MPTPSEYFKDTAAVVITGGSSGIGSALIKAIANLNSSTLLCNLSRTKPDFFEGNRYFHVAADLCRASELACAATKLEAFLENAPNGRVVLINNSGFGDYGSVDELEMEKQLDMMQLNMSALVALTMRLLPLLRQRGGAVVNVASTAAFQPVPGMATYAASKAFVLHWSLALSEDLRGSGVCALAVCPGPTRSNFFRAAGFASPPLQGGLNRWLDMSAEAVADRTLCALARGRKLVITGWKNRFTAVLSHFLPKPVVARFAGAAMRRLRLEQYRK